MRKLRGRQTSKVRWTPRETTRRMALPLRKKRRSKGFPTLPAVRMPEMPALRLSSLDSTVGPIQNGRHERNEKSSRRPAAGNSDSTHEYIPGYDPYGQLARGMQWFATAH